MASASGRYGPSGQLQAAMQMICDHLAQSASKVGVLFREWDADGNGLLSKAEVRVKACLAHPSM